MGLPTKLWVLSCKAHRRGLTPLAKLIKMVNFSLFHAVLPYQAEIEPDLILKHHALGVVVHPNVKIGRGVLFYHGVTLAAETRIGSEHKIHIGNGVTIGAGASVIGRGDKSLYIGDNVFIGAGAVVTGDVASDQTVVGIPAKPLVKNKV